MSVLLSKPVQERLAKPETLLRFTLPKLISRLERIGAGNVERDPDVRRVYGASEEIYSFRMSGVRVLFTKKGRDLVLLSIENG